MSSMNEKHIEADVYPQFDHMHTWHTHFQSCGNDHDDAITNGRSHAQAGLAALVLFVNHTTSLTETPPLYKYFSFGRNLPTYDMTPKAGLHVLWYTRLY